MAQDDMYVRIDLIAPDAPPLAHVAEVRPTDSPSLCAMQRIIELGDGSSITGLARGQHSRGMSALPQEFVPHPDTYADMPDISATILSKDEFEGLWQEALQKFPDF